jgi:Peptidase family M23
MRACLAALPFFLAAFSVAARDTPSLGLPIACTPGKDCFLQQYADMDAGSAATDPFCGTATYDGHKGTDIRVDYMSDAEKGVPVVASADGNVTRLRDGEPDRIMRSEADRAAVADKECGNGVVIDHGGGWETQYCHMKQGSISVKEGDAVKAGDTLGQVGASGMAQFPHVHLSVRKDGAEIDPFTGKRLDEGCSKDAKSGSGLWTDAAAKALDRPATQMIDAGFAPGAIDHATLTDVRPQDASKDSGAIVGWASLINLQKGDRIVLVLNGPSGGVLARQSVPPLDRTKATYSLFAGKRGAPAPGNYRLSVEVLRDGNPVLSETRETTIN